jgi:hypothetical protein
VYSLCMCGGFACNLISVAMWKNCGEMFTNLRNFVVVF